MSQAALETRLNAAALDNPSLQQTLDFDRDVPSSPSSIPSADAEHKDAESLQGDDKAHVKPTIDQDDGVTRIEALCR